MGRVKQNQVKGAVVAALAAKRLRGESLDVIADEIVMVSDAIKKMRTSRLTEDTMLLLIQNAIGQSGATRYRKISLKAIKAVVEGIEGLAAKHLKEEK